MSDAREMEAMPQGAAANIKPKKKKTPYNFFVQTCREEYKKAHPEESVSLSEFTKKCGEKWSTLPDEDKQLFKDMAERDKQRFDLEMQDYVPPANEEARGKKRKRKAKDPNAPKRALSAFFWFCNDERAKVKGMNPTFGVGDVAKELGRLWKSLEPEAKSSYESMAAKDKARYGEEMAAYKIRLKEQEQQDARQAANAEYEDDDEYEDVDEEEEED